MGDRSNWGTGYMPFIAYFEKTKGEKYQIYGKPHPNGYNKKNEYLLFENSDKQEHMKLLDKLKKHANKNGLGNNLAKVRMARTRLVDK